ncbi:flagellar biosynthesis regulator FlaF [Methylobacterium nigriterrae]|uniref:flagellar biosynthesis regulator FlaF n=1 Tax=Methylobacterium nigriterrae TaxID=3127512 RepID=UPI003013C2B5
MSYGASAYARVSQVAMSPREAEAAVLIKAARQLQSVRDDWANQAPALNQALVFNQKVWTILASAATEADNPLPPDVKQNLANLAVFVFRRIIDTMAEPKADKLSALISINHNLAAGLHGR